MYRILLCCCNFNYYDSVAGAYMLKETAVIAYKFPTPPQPPQPPPQRPICNEDRHTSNQGHTSHHVTPHHHIIITPRHNTSPHFTSNQVTTRHSTPHYYHITSYHITSHHITRLHLASLNSHITHSLALLTIAPTPYSTLLN